MRKIIFAAILLGIFIDAKAADPITKQTLECGSANVLNLLAQAIQTSNGLPQSMNYDFNEIKETSRKGDYAFSCGANLKLVRQTDGAVVDQVNVVYSVWKKKGGSLNLSFKPQR